MSIFKRRPAPPELVENRYGFDDWLQSFSFMSHQYAAPPQSVSSWRDGEPIGADFAGHVAGAYRASGPIFACVLVRSLVFSEARFGYRRFIGGRPGDLFGDASLSILERPWPNGTTGELLTRMEQDASLAGNSFWTRRGDRLVRLRPDRVTIVSGSASDADSAEVDAEVIGYMYKPDTNAEPTFFDVAEVAHYSPIPDPLARWRGMSWLTPVLTEVSADRAATQHRWKFFENGATPNLVVKSDDTITGEQTQAIKDQFVRRFEGVDNAYKTLVLGGGLDVTVVGADFEQLDFKATQGAGESRIAAAAGVPPVIAGFSEGLAAATYSNYAQARRRFADGTIRPLWRIAAAALEPLIDVPDGAHLWYDDRDIAFLREDAKDRADVLGRDAATVASLIAAGYKPDAAVRAVGAQDLRLLDGEHTGLTSAQLLPPVTSEGDEIPAVA
jgi:HK97 family phage portal protein